MAAGWSTYAKRLTVVSSRDGEKVARLRGSLAQGWAREDLKRLERDTTCDRVRSYVAALLAAPVAQPAPQVEAKPQITAPQEAPVNTPELVASAQNELRRLGCFAGKDDGKLGEGTSEALKRYLAAKGRRRSPKS